MKNRTNEIETGQLMLVQRELDLLKKHLSVSDLSNYNRKRLLIELKSAMVMKDNELPADAVCIDCEVEIREIESGQDFKFEIVSPAQASMQKRRIPVFAPIAIALLGYRKDSIVKWEMPNGIKTFQILKVQRR